MPFKSTFTLTNPTTKLKCRVTVQIREADTKQIAAKAARKALAKHFPSYKIRLVATREQHQPSKGTEDAIRKTTRRASRGPRKKSQEGSAEARTQPERSDTTSPGGEVGSGSFRGEEGQTQAPEEDGILKAEGVA